MLKPEGIIPAMVTPFTKEQQLNEGTLRELVNRFITVGVDGLFCMGTNGEFFSLSYDEKIRIAEIVVDAANGRIPIYVGVGCVSTEETIRLTDQVAKIGVDAVSIITPYFLSFTQEELLEHYKNIAQNTDLPIVLYNIPSRTGNSLSAQTVKELSEIENIVGIKDSSGAFDNILRYLESTPANFSVLAGTDSLILPTLMAGGAGAIASTANVLPDVVVGIYRSWKSGNFNEAEELQRELRGIRLVMEQGTLPSVLKEVMNLIGFDVGLPRRPVKNISESARQHVNLVVERYKNRGLL